MNCLKFFPGMQIVPLRYIHDRSGGLEQPASRPSPGSFAGAIGPETGQPAKCDSARQGDNQRSGAGETDRVGHRGGSRPSREVVREGLAKLSRNGKAAFRECESL